MHPGWQIAPKAQRYVKEICGLVRTCLLIYRYYVHVVGYRTAQQTNALINKAKIEIQVHIAHIIRRDDIDAVDDCSEFF